MCKCYKRKSEIVTRRILDETVLVPVANSVSDLHAIFSLNELGSVIWELIDGKKSTRGIAAAICEEYDVTEEEALRDVTRFLSSLAELGLVGTEALAR